MKSAKAWTAAVLLSVTFGDIAMGGGHSQAQRRYSFESTAKLINDANEECFRAYHAIKQAIKRQACVNQNAQLIKPYLPYPDLWDQELDMNLAFAEKVQNGKMTLIERSAAISQLHSQMAAEAERRSLASRSVRAQEGIAAAAQQPIIAGGGGDSGPAASSDAPRLQNILPQTTRCQSIRVGVGMVQTVCR